MTGGITVALTVVAIQSTITGWLGFTGVTIVLVLIILWLANRKP